MKDDAGKRTRPDGRRVLLVYLRPTIIKRLKIVALDESRPVYGLTEEAISAWLAARQRLASQRGTSSRKPTVNRGGLGS
jgi:hypothetical protein